MRDITLGQFVAGNSLLHQCDPRTKILIMIVYVAMVFFVESIPVFILPFAFLLLALILSKIPVSYILKSLKPIRLLLVFMFILNLFFTTGEHEIFQIWIWRLTWEAIYQSFFITIRIALLVTGASLLTLTTSPIKLTDGIERLMNPLRVIHFPAHELAMMMTIALRFIPTLIEESDKIMKAQLSRGADLESGNLFARVKSMIPILIPLFVSSFRKADELATAMESRCYHGGEGRTRLHSLKFGKQDLFAGLITLAFFGATLAVFIIW